MEYAENTGGGELNFKCSPSLALFITEHQKCLLAEDTQKK